MKHMLGLRENLLFSILERSLNVIIIIIYFKGTLKFGYSGQNTISKPTIISHSSSLPVGAIHAFPVTLVEADPSPWHAEDNNELVARDSLEGMSSDRVESRTDRKDWSSDKEEWISDQEWQSSDKEEWQSSNKEGRSSDKEGRSSKREDKSFVKVGSSSKREVRSFDREGRSSIKEGQVLKGGRGKLIRRKRMNSNCVFARSAVI